ncbi:MAG: rhomboid family intramembrane serine protease [Candidatus Thermoplasmatota archaeon]
MELMLHPESIVAICIMVGALIIGALKKWMITYILIAANFFVFVLTLIFQVPLPQGGSISRLVLELGFKPVYLNIGQLENIYTIFTSMFIHGGFLHILGNMFIFFFIGMHFEERVGWKKFLGIYLISGVIGTLTHSILNLGSVTSLIGASGAIFGIMGAFAFSYPHDKVVLPIPLGIIMIFRRIKVIYAVLLFAVIETVIVIVGVQDSTAHFAHLGGLAGGVLLAALLVGKKHKRNSRRGPQKIYLDNFEKPLSKKVNYENLKELADTKELKEMLKRIQNENVEQVRDLWLEHFLEKTSCPKCGNKLNHFSGKIWCEKCGFKTKY